jgi:hypothetical protein
MVAEERPMLIADTGGAARAANVSGISLNGCGVHGAVQCMRSGHISPTVIDRGNSITVTLAFNVESDSQMCSVDFSMPVVVNKGAQRSDAQWRLITIGLPNVRLC